jgi:hypothetical protein
MSTDPDLIEIANKIIIEYRNTDINTIKKSDFLWTEQGKYNDFDEKKMVSALRNYVIEMKRLPTSDNELIPFFVNLPNGGSRKRRLRKSKRLRRKKGSKRRGTRRKYF